MTADELKAYKAALEITDGQWAAMTVTSAANFLNACAAAKRVDLEAQSQAMMQQVLALQIEALAIHIACDREAAAAKDWALDVPKTPAFAP